MVDKSRCQKQTHVVVDMEGEEVAMARVIKVEEVSSSSYSCTYSTAQGSANYQNYCSHQLVFVWFLMHSHFMAM